MSRRPLPGYPREIRSVAHPFARRDSATARQSCLGSARARPAVHRYLSVLATNEPEMRLADVCNPHVKDEHPMNRVASGFVVEGAPDLTGGRCLHAATARFGQISAAPTGVLFPLELATEPGPLMPPSPPRTKRDVSSLDSFQPRPLPPPPNVMGFGLFGPRHLPSTEEPFSGPFPILDSAFRRAPVHDRCFAFGGS